MTPKEIHSFLHSRFGQHIGPWEEPAAGDSWIQVEAPGLFEVCQSLRDEAELAFDFLRLVSAVDRTTHLSSVYHLYSYTHLHGIVLRVDLDRETPQVASLCKLWPAADWLERECYDMMGIQYEGHPELSRILLPLDWKGYPLRKDYQAPEEYHGVQHDD